MSEKILNTLSDEKRNLQKQMGCMNGIFQLFDRHHYFTSRRLSSHSHKKLLSGSKHNVELEMSSEKETASQWNREIGYEKHRTSTESSRTSSSSSFSSVDHTASSKLSRTSSRRHSFAESPVPLGRQSPDIRDVVKDAMHRETRGLSIKMVAKEEGKNHVMKHIDSPRPLHNANSWKPSVGGVEGLTQSLPKYREGPREEKEEANTSVRQRLKDPPRFSYDSRESRETTRSRIKFKELPRLSLDSRDTRTRQAFDLTPTSLLRNSGEGRVHSEPQEPSSNRSSTVIEKLMGLEPFRDRVSVSTPSPSTDINKPHDAPLSPRLQKDPNAPGSGKTTFGEKKANSRLPVEQAPWRQQKANREPRASSTIYGQIEKRITDLEFKGSAGRDLRALKQILEAMQKTNIRLTNQQEEVDLESQTSRCSIVYNDCNQQTKGNNPVETTIKSLSPRKPQTLVDKTRSNPQQPEKRIRGRLVNTLQSSKETRHKKEQNSTVPTKSSGIMSPRTRQKQQLQEKRNPNNPSSERMAREHPSSPNRKPKVKSIHLQGEDRKCKLDRETRDRLDQDDAALLLSDSNNSSTTPMDTDFTSTYSYENRGKQGGDKNRDLSLRLKNDAPLAELVIPTAEQPSPISVLDASFYREESPSPVKKIPTPFTDDDFLCGDEAEWSPEIEYHLQETRVPNLSVELYNEKMEDVRSLVRKLDQLRVPHAATTRHIESLPDNANPDQRYITKILLASGLIKDTSFLSIPIQRHANGHVISPELFHVLEQTEGQNDFSAKTSQLKANQKTQRKIVFDTVSEILARKLVSEKSTPQGFRGVSGIALLKEIHLEIERLQKLSHSRNGEHHDHDHDHDQEDHDHDHDHDQEDHDHDHDQVLAIFAEDMAHESEKWKDYQGEIPSLVLDIERLIFKDLINETINDEIIGQQNRHRPQPNPSKKLFYN